MFSLHKLKRKPDHETKSKSIEIRPDVEVKSFDLRESNSTSSILHKLDCVTESELVRQVRKISETSYPPNNKPIFRFENTEQAAKFNTEILKSFNWDVQAAIDAQSNTILHPGSEFRPLDDVKEVFENHCDWEKYKILCTLGAQYSLPKSLDYPDEIRLSDLKAQIAKGNNKSAKTKESEDFIKKNYDKEVQKAWMIPIFTSAVPSIPKAGAIPISVVTQHTINEDNERIEKQRMAHDLSSPMESGRSVNNMVDEDLMDACLFGFCMLRVLHNLHSMRIRHPTRRILLGKIDLDAAFRRLHVWLAHALLSFTIIRNLAYLLFRMPFGAKDGPSKHEIPSNMTVDLAQALIDDETWDPFTLRSPNEHLIPPPFENTDDSEFGIAYFLAIKFKDRDCYVDGYVDDLITLVVETSNSIIERARNAIALAIHILFRPRNTNDPIHRDDVLSLRKLLAEGRLEEQKVFLGWLIDTRRFIIRIPYEKATSWIMDIDDLIRRIGNKEWIRQKEWESIFGKANSANYINREGRFFTTGLRYEIKKCRANKGRSKASIKALHELNMQKKTIEKLTTIGRSINHTTITLPHIFTKQDASDDGLGGFNCMGVAWRFIIPIEVRKILHVNILEFMAVVVTTWLTFKALGISGAQGLKLLAQSDSTSALGWLRFATIFDPLNPISTVLRENIGRKLGELLLDADMSLYSQHVVGSTNTIADYLSRNVQQSNSQQLLSIFNKYGNDTPQNLRIVDLPDEIFSWMLSIWEKSIQMQGLLSVEKTRLMAALRNGRNSQPKPTLTLTSEILMNSKNSRSLVDSRTESDIISLAQRLGMNLEDPQFAPMSSTYLRPFNRMGMTIPSEHEMDD